MGDVSNERRSYVRVYMDDLMRDYPQVWADKSALGTWITLLSLTDKMWPAQAELPRSIVSRSLRVLTDCGLVELLPSHCYRIKGYDSERTERQQSARNAAAVSWQSRRNATADATALLSPSPIPDQSKATRATDDDGRADLEAFVVIKRRAPTPRQRQLLDDVLSRHDLTGPAWAADLMFRSPDDPIGAVIEADKAWRAEQIAKAQAAEKPKPRVKRRAGLPQSTRELLDEWARQKKGDAA